MDLYELCRFCADGTDQINRINVWKPNTGFVHQLKLERSFKNNFHKTNFNVVYARPQYKRRQQLHTMSRILNATFKYNNQGRPRMLLKYLNAGGFLRRRFHMIGYPLALENYKYYGAVNAPCMETDQTIIISGEPPRSLTWYAFLQPLDKVTMVCIALSFIIGGYVLSHVRKYITGRDNMGNSYWDITCIYCWDSINSQQYHVSVNILLICYMLASFILVNLYCGDLAAALVKPGYSYPPIDNIAQVWQSDKKVLVYAGWGKHYSMYFNKSLKKFETYTPVGVTRRERVVYDHFVLKICFLVAIFVIGRFLFSRFPYPYRD